MYSTWYFAYGSNLCTEQMIARTGSANLAGQQSKIALLADHRLVFQMFNPEHGAFANIAVPGPGVLGVVYRCSAVDLEKLDRYESGYVRRVVMVTCQNGESCAATAYVIRAELPATPGKPSAAYLERIVRGARRHGLPESYIYDLIAMADTEPA